MSEIEHSRQKRESWIGTKMSSKSNIGTDDTTMIPSTQAIREYLNEQHSNNRENFIVESDASINAALTSPNIAVKVSTANRTVLLPEPANVTVDDNTSHFITVKNVGDVDAATTSSDLADLNTDFIVEVGIAGTDQKFLEGLEKIGIGFGEELTFRLIRIGTLKVWKLKDTKNFHARLKDTLAAVTGGTHTALNISIWTTNDLSNSLWEVDATNANRLNVKASCKINVDFCKVIARYTGTAASDEKFITLFVRKNGESTGQFKFQTGFIDHFDANTYFNLIPEPTSLIEVSAGDYLEFTVTADDDVVHDYYRMGISTTI